MYEHACLSFAAPFCAVVVGTENLIPTRCYGLQLPVINGKGLAHHNTRALTFAFVFCIFIGTFRAWRCFALPINTFGRFVQAFASFG